MKKKFLWFPIFISLSVTTLFPSCVSVKTVDEIIIGGAILAAGGILSLFTKNDDKKQDKVSSNESKQEATKTQEITESKNKEYYIFNVTLENYKEKFAEKEFGQKFDNVINVSGNYNEVTFKDMVKLLQNTKNLVLDLSNITGMTKIPDGAFSNYYELKKVVLPTSLENISKNAFCRCEKLESLNIPENVSVIGPYAFWNAPKLESIIIPKNVSIIEERTFYECKNLASVEIKGNIEIIKESAFYGCENLKTVKFNGYVKNIDGYAFFDCKALKSINLKEGLEKIGDSAFVNCKELTSLKLPSTVKILGSRFIHGCSKLTKITLPKSLDMKSSSSELIYENEHIKEIVLEEGIKTFDVNIYGCVNLEKISIPSTLTPNKYGNFHSFAGCSKLKFKVSPNSKTFSTIKNGSILVSKDKKKMYAWPSASGKIKIPDEIELYQDYLFSGNEKIEEITSSKNITRYEGFNCKGVKKFIIPEGVKEIDNLDVLSFENLEIFQIPSTLTFIGHKGTAKYDPDVIKIPTFNSQKVKFKVGKENQLFTTIKDGSVIVSKDKKVLYSYPSATGDITISDGVTTIANDAFKGANIQTLVLDESVTEVGEHAFALSKVKTVKILSKQVHFQYEAFADCTNLETVEIKGDVIGTPGNWKEGSIFVRCSNLKDIKYNGTVALIDESFEDCINLTQFSIPEGVERIAMETFTNCENLIYFDVSKNKNFKTLENGSKLMSADGKCLIFWPKASGNVVVPAGVEYLYTEVFSTCKNPITTITLPKSLKDIGGHYDPCALSYIMDSLKHIYFEGTKEQWKSIITNMNPFTSRDLQEIPTTYNYKK